MVSPWIHFYKNAVVSVAKPPTLLVLLPSDQTGWCEQFSQEGYQVVHLTYPLPQSTSFRDVLKDAGKEITANCLEANWGLVTYGLATQDAGEIITQLALAIADLKVCVHFCPNADTSRGFLIKDSGARHLPVTFHLASSQEALHASLLPLEDLANLGYALPTHSHPPVKVYTYPFVTHSPPFPFAADAPVRVKVGESSTVDAYTRSAVNLSLTRTLEALKRYLGPHFNFEKLWDMHTYYEFVERHAPKTMSTMVETPYVNHVPTMTGGVGSRDLARFYKYHFTTVTPTEFEIITLSRTIGSDRIVDEMIFKCVHTSEIDYFLHGVPPTGKPLEIAMVGIIAFRGDKLFFEYWDQASLLVQLGLLNPTHLPIAGVEVAKKVIDPFGQPSNTLLKRWDESEGLPIE
ncbi:NTF2-like protein [Paxillus ammoniavirescens]|nr:NTF2-like protein [Paxillus ammoniavirescens]